MMHLLTKVYGNQPYISSRVVSPSRTNGNFDGRGDKDFDGRGEMGDRSFHSLGSKKKLFSPRSLVPKGRSPLSHPLFASPLPSVL
jgi:hypothetical protein